MSLKRSLLYAGLLVVGAGMIWYGTRRPGPIAWTSRALAERAAATAEPHPAAQPARRVVLAPPAVVVQATADQPAPNENTQRLRGLAYERRDMAATMAPEIDSQLEIVAGKLGWSVARMTRMQRWNATAQRLYGEAWATPINGADDFKEASRRARQVTVALQRAELRELGGVVAWNKYNRARFAAFTGVDLALPEEPPGAVVDAGPTENTPSDLDRLFE